MTYFCIRNIPTGQLVRKPGQCPWLYPTRHAAEVRFRHTLGMGVTYSRKTHDIVEVEMTIKVSP